jgi:RNA polymerase sigma factor for flagellar operon FliA
MTTARRTFAELIEEGQPLVHSLAAKIYRNIPFRVDIDDLIAYGEVGLTEAAKNFDPDQGSQFTTFAFYRIQGAIYDGVSKMSWTSRARYRRLRYQQISNEVLATDADDTDPIDGDLKSQATWFRNITRNLGVVYINSQGQDESGRSDYSITDSRMEASHVIAQREISAKLKALVDAMSAPQSQLIRYIYYEGLNLEEAGRRLGISKSWACRLHAKILEELARSLKKIGAD